MNKNVVIVNFNTTELTRAAIQSLLKNTPDANVTVFDNSDRIPFGEMDGVSVIDNTSGQIIDFDKFLSNYPSRTWTTNNWGSAKHSYTIQYLFSMFPEGFVLMDSDILVKKDISSFFDESVVYVGEGANEKDRPVPRLLPFLCWLNPKLAEEYGISYFDENRNWKLYPRRPLYDTGASFLEDCRKKDVPRKEVIISDYIIHFGGGSYQDKNWHHWLEKYKHLYTMEENKQKEKKTGEPYLVVIPFFKGGAQGRELEYAVEGWRRHFKEPYQIVLVGDYHPVVDTGDDITFIECERVPEQPPFNYRPHIDFVKKFKAVHKAFPDSKGFIFVADDCYAVNDFDIYDVMFLKQNGDRITVHPGSHAPWFQEKNKTYELLKSNGYPVRNFTTHLPYYFEWDKIEALWERFDMEHNSYIIEDLYYNIYFADRIAFQLDIDHDNLKCGVYRQNPRLNYIARAFDTKIWIQNSVEGWIPALEEMLRNYYKI